MTISTCIYCGAIKKAPLKVCNDCKESPTGSNLDMAKSIYLSNTKRNIEYGLNFDLESLKDVGRLIKGGGMYYYNEKILNELVMEKELLDSDSSSAWKVVLFGVLFLLLPLAAVLLFLYRSFF